MAFNNRREAGAKVRNGSKTVTGTASQVVDLNTQRVSLSMRNYGPVNVFFGFDSSVTHSTGYPILPDEDYEIVDYVGPVFIVRDPALTNGDLRFYEVY